MNDKVNKYLTNVERELPKMASEDKKEILAEIESHIYEAIKRQVPVDEILKQLGDPVKLAKSYETVYRIENNEITVKDNLLGIGKSIGIYFSVSMASLIVVIFLGVLSFVLPLTGVLVIGFAIINLLGFVNIPFNLGPIMVTGISQIIMGAIFFILFIYLGMKCSQLLKTYLKHVSVLYQQNKFENLLKK